MPVLEPVSQIWTAIEQTRVLRLMYHGKERILEPHDHGILNGSVQLLEPAVKRTSPAFGKRGPRRSRRLAFRISRYMNSVTPSQLDSARAAWRIIS
jgi:hypothetical protein